MGGVTLVAILLLGALSRGKFVAAQQDGGYGGGVNESAWFVNSSNSLFDFQGYRPFEDINPSSPLPMVFHSATPVGLHPLLASDKAWLLLVVAAVVALLVSAMLGFWFAAVFAELCCSHWALSHSRQCCMAQIVGQDGVATGKVCLNISSVAIPSLSLLCCTATHHLLPANASCLLHGRATCWCSADTLLSMLLWRL